MKMLGHIRELWRYPISSLGGEACDALHLAEKGFSGDRRFGLFDVESGVVAAPEKDLRWRPALLLRSRIDVKGRTLVCFPDGAELHVGDRQLEGKLTQHFGFPVSIGRYADQPESVGPTLPVIARSYAASPIHLLTSASVQTVAEHSFAGEADRRRFRPSLFLATDEEDGFPEDSWIGAILCIGTVRAIVIERTKRCGMTISAQTDLPEQPDILRTILRRNHRCLGVYCDVIATGVVETGAAVFLEE